MQAIDVQVQTFTKEAKKYHPNPEAIELVTRTVFKRESAFMSEEEFIAGLRNAGVKAILMSPMGWATTNRDLNKIADMHNYIGHLKRLFGDWENERYKPEVLEKVYYKNTQRIFGFAL